MLCTSGAHPIERRERGRSQSERGGEPRRRMQRIIGECGTVVGERTQCGVRAERGSRTGLLRERIRGTQPNPVERG